jgi:hypothetical protein
MGEHLSSLTMGELLAKPPVLFIENQVSGLWGAVFHGQQILQKRDALQGAGNQ